MFFHVKSNGFVIKFVLVFNFLFHFDKVSSNFISNSVLTIVANSSHKLIFHYHHFHAIFIIGNKLGLCDSHITAKDMIRLRLGNFVFFLPGTHFKLFFLSFIAATFLCAGKLLYFIFYHAFIIY